MSLFDRVIHGSGDSACADHALEVDGQARRQGTGAEVMDDPLRPLLWLAEERRRWGDGLRAGETISTGSMTGMLPIRAGAAGPCLVRYRSHGGDRLRLM